MDISRISACFKLSVLLILTLQCTTAFYMNPLSPYIGMRGHPGIHPFVSNLHNYPGQMNPILGQYNLNQAHHHKSPHPNIKILNMKKNEPSNPRSIPQKGRQPPQYNQTPNFKTSPVQSGAKMAGKPNQFRNGPSQQNDKKLRNTPTNGYAQEFTYMSGQRQYNDKPNQKRHNGGNYKNSNYNTNEEYGNGKEYSNDKYNGGSYQGQGNSETEHGYNNNHQNGNGNYHNQNNDISNQGHGVIYNQQHDDETSGEYDTNKNHNQYNEVPNKGYEDNDDDDDDQYSVVTNGAKKEYANNNYQQNQNNHYSNKNYPPSSYGNNQGNEINYNQNLQNYGGNKQSVKSGYQNQNTYNPTHGYVNNKNKVSNYGNDNYAIQYNYRPTHGNVDNNYKSKYTHTISNNENYPSSGGGYPPSSGAHPLSSGDEYQSPVHGHVDNSNKNKYSHSANLEDNSENYPPSSGSYPPSSNSYSNSGSYPPSSGKEYQNTDAGGYDHSDNENNDVPPPSSQNNHNSAQGHSGSPYETYGVNQQHTQEFLDHINDPSGIKTNIGDTENEYNQEGFNPLHIPLSFGSGHGIPDISKLFNGQVYIHEPISVINERDLLLAGFPGI